MAIDPQDVRIMLDGFEKKIFVRSIDGDDKPGWAIDLLPYISALARLRQATDRLDSKEMEEARREGELALDWREEDGNAEA